MGKASRIKAENRLLREARAAEAATRQEQVPTVRGPRRLASFFTADGPPSDFPVHSGLGALLLALLVAVSYYPAAMAGFVWDDIIFAEAKPIQEWSGIWSIWFSPASLAQEGHYWPVTYTSFWLEHKLWGLEPSGYHAVNILLQLVNTLLVWRLMLRLAVPGAWLIAAVFAVHPLHVESVAWIIERKDLLSGLLYLSAALVWLRFMEEPRWRHYLTTMGLFVASLLSKTVTVTFPAALLVLYWWKQGCVKAKDVLLLLPFFAVGFAITLGDLSYYASREPLALDFSFVERMQIASHALWFYVGKILWPVELVVIYPFWDIGAGNLVAWGYVIAAVVLAAGLWFARARVGRGPLAGALFFLVTLSPVLGFVDYGYMQFSFVADRFQYLAGIGVMAVLVGAAVHSAGSLPEMAKKGLCGIALLGVAVMAGLSWKQSHIYHDDIAFFSHIIDHNPEARDAHHNLGRALQDADRMEEALAAARVAIERRPNFSGTYSNLGLALKSLGMLEEAEEVLRRGREVNPRDKVVLQNLAEVIRQRGRHEESLKWYDATLELDRNYVRTHAGKGDALFRLKRYDEAIVHLKKALSLEPNMSQAGLIHAFIGESAQELGRFEEARRHYDRALQIDPKMTHVHANLLGMLFDQQRDAEVERYLQAVQNLSQGDPSGLQNVAEFFRKRKQYGKSLEWYDKVLQIDPDYAQAYAGKGDVLFRLKRYEEAIEFLRQAIALEPTMSTVPTLRTLIGEAAQALGWLEVAGEQYGLILEDDPSHLAAIDHLAKVRYEQGRYEDALKLYRKRLAIDPDHANTYTNLGIVFYKTNRLKEAKANLKRALSLDPTAPMAQAVLELIRRESQ